MFFKLVGWDFAESGSKAPEFAELFQALGVMIDVRMLHEGMVTVGNTEARRLELFQVLQSVLDARCLTRHHALKLRDRLQFAAGNLFGRIARSSFAIITQHAYSGVSSKLDPRSVMALQLHVRLLQHSRPHELRASANNVWFIQTDACYEPGDDEVFAGVGAVLFDSSRRPLKFFGQRLSTELLQRLNPTSQRRMQSSSLRVRIFRSIRCLSLVGLRDNGCCRDLHRQQCSA